MKTRIVLESIKQIKIALTGLELSELLESSNYKQEVDEMNKSLVKLMDKVVEDSKGTFYENKAVTLKSLISTTL